MTNPPHRPSRSIPARPSGAQRAVDQDEVEKQAALRDVMEHAVRHTRAVTMAKPMVSWRAQPIMLAAAAAVSVVFAAYANIARPDFVFGSAPSGMPAEQREAGMRFGMYLLGQRLEQYRTERGTLPPNLDYLDETWPGISYQALSASTFELRSRIDSTVVVFRSDQPVDEFLGSSLNFIRWRP